jgi:hypothetical protein
MPKREQQYDEYMNTNIKILDCINTDVILFNDYAPLQMYTLIIASYYSATSLVIYLYNLPPKLKKLLIFLEYCGSANLTRICNLPKYLNAIIVKLRDNAIAYGNCTPYISINQHSMLNSNYISVKSCGKMLFYSSKCDCYSPRTLIAYVFNDTQKACYDYLPFGLQRTYTDNNHTACDNMSPYISNNYEINVYKLHCMNFNPLTMLLPFTSISKNSPARNAPIKQHTSVIYLILYTNAILAILIYTILSVLLISLSSIYIPSNAEYHNADSATTLNIALCIIIHCTLKSVILHMQRNNTIINNYTTVLNKCRRFIEIYCLQFSIITFTYLLSALICTIVINYLLMYIGVPLSYLQYCLQYYLQYCIYIYTLSEIVRIISMVLYEFIIMYQHWKYYCGFIIGCVPN